MIGDWDGSDHDELASIVTHLAEYPPVTYIVPRGESEGFYWCATCACKAVGGNVDCVLHASFCPYRRALEWRKRHVSQVGR